MNSSIGIQPNDIPEIADDDTITSQLSQGFQPAVRANTSRCQDVDLSLIISASQVLASTTDHDALLAQVTQLMLQHSGADHCTLLLPTPSGEWQVRAIATPQSTELHSTALEGNPHVPVKLIEYVKETKTVVIINDLNTDLPVIDTYLKETSPKSIRCQPLLNQNSVVGIVSLQHQATSGLFAESPQSVLNFLCGQAAIFLENARLHQSEQEKTKQLELSETKLRNLYENAADPILLLGEKAFVDCNRAAVDLFEARHKGQLCLAHPADISPEFQADGQLSFDKAQAMIKQGMENGSHRFEWQHQTLTGRVFWAEVVLTPLRYQGEMVLHSIVRDISQRKAAETKILQKSQELEQALSQLKNSQANLIQSEKMSALGNLVAGVAHEINNPIGFLKGSIKNAQEYVSDLQSQLSLYQQHYPNPVEAIEENAETIDLDYVCSDLPKLLTSMQGAANRIKSISTSLRTFSRADTEHKVSADLHEGLDSTLLILKYRLKADEKRPEINVIKNYGELPILDCFPGQLNQVFMNVLANAIDAFDEAAQNSTFAALTERSQSITINTAFLPEPNVIEIRIRDNGQGMPPEVKERIFDHLFTTKAVGKGTGLGLDIAQKIIAEVHGGTIAVQSDLGVGTEFCIQLPV